MSRFTKWLEDVMFERGGRKYNQSTLAREIGVRPTTVSEWFTKERIPDRGMIQQIAVHFGTTSRHIYELLGETPPDGLNDDEEIMMGWVKRLARQGQEDSIVRLILEKAAKGELSHATKEQLARIMLEGSGQSDVHVSGGEPVAKVKPRAKAKSTAHHDRE